MNIILGETAKQQIGDRYIVLELDIFAIDGKLVPSYCVLDAGDIPLSELQDIPLWIDNHNKILENYRKQNWNFCEQMIEHIQKRWGGSLNSFYLTLYSRIQELKQQDLPENWNGAVST